MKRDFPEFLNESFGQVFLSLLLIQLKILRGCVGRPIGIFEFDNVFRFTERGSDRGLERNKFSMSNRESKFQLFDPRIGESRQDRFERVSINKRG